MAAVSTVPAKPASGAFAAPSVEPPARGDAPPSSGTLERLARFSEIARQADSLSSSEAARVPPATPAPLSAPFETASARAPEEAAEISFGESAAPPPASDEPAVKHVKVRSSVDILSELDKLRKLSTQKAAGGSGQGARLDASRPRSPGVSIDDLLASNLNHKKDVTRSFDLTIPRQVLGRSRQVTIDLKFSDGAGIPLPTDSSFSIDLATSTDLQKLLLSLRFNVQAD
jgi:hypothetical protein